MRQVRSFHTIVVAVLLWAGGASALEMTTRQVTLGSDLTLSAAHKVAESLYKLDAAGTEPILLIVATRSGYAPAAMVVADAIQTLSSKVYAVVTSEAFGAGAIVAAFCDRRYIFKHGAFLFDELAYDSEKVMKEKAPLPPEAAEAYLNSIYEAVAKRLGMSTAEFKKKAISRWYLPASAAKKAGVATEVVAKVSWVDLVEETVEIKKTSTVKRKRPIPESE